MLTSGQISHPQGLDLAPGEGQVVLLAALC